MSVAMDGRDLRILNAHSAAGHFALGVVSENGADMGGAILAAYVRALMLAYAAVEGWPAVDRLVAEISHSRPKPERSRPVLHAVQG